MALGIFAKCWCPTHISSTHWTSVPVISILVVVICNSLLMDFFLTFVWKDRNIQECPLGDSLPTNDGKDLKNKSPSYLPLRRGNTHTEAYSILSLLGVSSRIKPQEPMADICLLAIHSELAAFFSHFTSLLLCWSFLGSSHK